MAVYFIQCEATGLVKIGYTKGCAYARMRFLQTGSGARLALLGVLPDGGTADERRLHHALRELRRHGEWFELSRCDIERETEGELVMPAEPDIERRRWDRCKRGHEHTAENTRFDNRGARNCRECARILASAPEAKAARREYERKRKSTPRYKAQQREYNSRPERKAKVRARQSTPEFKARQRARYLRDCAAAAAEGTGITEYLRMRVARRRSEKPKKD